MARWDRFVLEVDKEREKYLKKIIRSERELVQLLELGLNNKYFFEKIEPKDEQVAFGSIYRCIVCLSSMMVLLVNGYIGSTNALLRQCYEYLCWAKFAIDNEDINILNKLHDSFYSDATGRADILNQYFKKTSYIIDSDDIDISNIKDEGKKIFS